MRLRAGAPSTIVQARREYRAALMSYYHAHLATTIDTVSPLLIDLSAIHRVDLEDALRRLRPPPGWPQRNRRFSQLLRSGVRPPCAHAKGALGGQMTVVQEDSSLEVRAWLGSAFAVSGGGELQLLLPARLPSTIQTAMVGRPLAEVIDHPALRMRTYTVLRSWDLGNGTAVDVRAPHLSYQVPWASGS